MSQRKGRAGHVLFLRFALSRTWAVLFALALSRSFLGSCFLENTKKNPKGCQACE
jgi:hypothetical protein